MFSQYCAIKSNAINTRNNLRRVVIYKLLIKVTCATRNANVRGEKASLRGFYSQRI